MAKMKTTMIKKGSRKATPLGKKAMAGKALMGASMTMPTAPKKGGKMPMLKVKGK